MRWSDVTAAPSPKTLRQFAGLLLIFAIAVASWRYAHGRLHGVPAVLAAAGAVCGLLGLVRPMAIRWLFTGWMIAVFPIGWTISRLMLGVLFFGLFTPVALVFRKMGRDSLRLRKQRTATSYWLDKPSVTDPADYFRQS